MTNYKATPNLVKTLEDLEKTWVDRRTYVEGRSIDKMASRPLDN